MAKRIRLRRRRRNRSQRGNNSHLMPEYHLLGFDSVSQAVTATKEFACFGLVPVSEIVLDYNESTLTSGRLSDTRKFKVNIECNSSDAGRHIIPVLVYHTVGDTTAFTEADNDYTLGGDKFHSIQNMLASNFSEYFAWKPLPALKKRLEAGSWHTWRGSYDVTKEVRNYEKAIANSVDSEDTTRNAKFTIFLIQENIAAVTTATSMTYNAEWQFDMQGLKRPSGLLVR